LSVVPTAVFHLLHVHDGAVDFLVTRSSSFCKREQPQKEEAMQYMLLIYDNEAQWGSLSD